MPENPVDLITPTVFLDTNVLVYLWSYLVRAREMALLPYPGDTNDISQVSNRLKEVLPDSIVGFYINGCKSLALLQEKAQRKDGEIGVQIFTSRLSKVEMLNGALDGKAHILMAKQGIPYRMRQRASNLSDLISTILRREDIDEVVKTINEINELLETKDGILIEYVEDKYKADEIALLAEFLSSRIYLDVIDIWMYSCAITAQAGLILCFDSYFKEVVNKTYSADGKWAEVRGEVVEFVKNLWGWDKVLLPQSPKKITEGAPHIWS